MPEALLKLFPTDRRRDDRNETKNDDTEMSMKETEQTTLEIVSQAYRFRKGTADECITESVHTEGDPRPLKRPGSQYKRYRKVKDLDVNIRELFEVASSLIGVKLEALINTAFEAELKLQKWAQREKRRRAATPLSEEEDFEHTQKSTEQDGLYEGTAANEHEM